jgi:hypothetical protein
MVGLVVVTVVDVLADDVSKCLTRLTHRPGHRGHRVETLKGTSRRVTGSRFRRCSRTSHSASITAAPPLPCGIRPADGEMGNGDVCAALGLTDGGGAGQPRPGHDP